MQLRRFATVRHVADLYDRYSVHRPEMLRSWASGQNQGTTPEGRWQADLWRQLTRTDRDPEPGRTAGSRRAARSGRTPRSPTCPERFSLFGLTRLPASYLDVLGALAAQHGRPPLLVAPVAGPLGRSWPTNEPPRRLRRVDDPTAGLTANPLLGSWGRDAREMQLVLASTGESGRGRPPAAAGGGATSVLQRIQGDIHADRSPPGAPLPGHQDTRAVLDPNDRSIQVHACHGRARQVEVLRDAMLHLLEDDPDLEPRDIVVMCPDIETFAPLIDATFGAADPADDEEVGVRHLPDLRVRLADRSLRQTNPILGVVARLLELATARVTASQVLDLAGRDPVRRRFGFDDDDLARLEEWVVGSGIRWGLDAERRAPFGLEGLEANTWRAGLDRTLLGVTMADEGQRLVGGVVPLDDVDSGDIDLVGRFAEFVDRLDAAVTSLGRAPVGRTPGRHRSRWPPTPSPRRRMGTPGSASNFSVCSTT